MKPKTNKCVHCLQEFDEMTWDHVFPKAWYPDDVTVENKWKVPACVQCNNRLSAIEKELWIAFGISHGGMHGISEKILRSIDVSSGRSEKDVSARKHAKESLQNKIKFYDKNNEGGFPNLDNRSLYSDNLIKLPGIEISRANIDKFAEKIIRGMTYIIDNKYITSDYNIEIYVVHEDSISSYLNDVWKQASIYKKPGIEIKRVSDETKNVCYRIVIWDRIIIYGSVIIKE